MTRNEQTPSDAPSQHLDVDLRAMLDRLPVGVGLVDAAGRILSLNPEGLRLHGFSSHEAMLTELEAYAEVFELCHADGRPMSPQQWPIARAFRGEDVHQYEVRLRRRGHPESVLSYSAVPAPPGPDGTARMVFMIQDVTVLQHTQERLRESERRKDEYLAMLGHELRNPLAAVRTAAELVKLTAGDEPRLQRACGVLERQTHHMARLIDGLLEVSRIARGKIGLEHESLDLRAVLEAVLEDRVEDFERRGLNLDKALPSSPIWLSGDYVRLIQVFDNLVANALEFTPTPGQVEVQAYASGEIAVVRIRDSGIGLQPHALTRIFEPFHQETQDLARVGGGLGLGLALAKGLVELHGGEIEAHSEGPGQGTLLEVRLPRPSRASMGAESLADASGADGQPSARRILIVEDNIDTGHMLRELLRISGHEVSVVATAPAALAALAEDDVDVVLCDIGLPGMDGYELARRIRADDDLRNLSLVAVTGYGQDEDREQARAAGFDEHLIKPVDLESLERVLDRL